MHEEWEEIDFAFAEAIHLRPLLQIVEEASKFKSQIEFLEGENRANAKSILDMIEFAALITRGGSGMFKLKAKGPDSGSAIKAISQFGCRRGTLGKEIVKNSAGSDEGSAGVQAPEAA